MSTLVRTPFLARVLVADAVVSGAVALLQLLAMARVAELTGLSGSLLLGTGWFLVGYVALLFVLASRARLPAALVWLVIVGNMGWAAGALVIAASRLPALGIAFSAVHAAAVLVFAALEYLGMRASPREARDLARAG